MNVWIFCTVCHVDVHRTGKHMETMNSGYLYTDCLISTKQGSKQILRVAIKQCVTPALMSSLNCGCKCSQSSS